MSENEKKEQINPIDHDQPKPVEEDKFMEALTKDKGDEGLKAAFKILSKGDEPTTRVEGIDLQRAVATRTTQDFSIEDAQNVIQLVNKKGLLNSNEFVNIINLIITLRAAKKDDAEGLKEAEPVKKDDAEGVEEAEPVKKDDAEGVEKAEPVKKDDAEGLEEAFGILSKGGLTVRVKHIKLVIAIRKISTQNDKEIFQLLDEEESINCEEFINIFKLLLGHDEGDQTKKIYEKLKKTNEDEEIILCGAEGVGKTWTAREVAALGVRKGEFDVVIWVYLDRIYEDDLSLQKSIASQLSVLAEYEEFVADQEAKKEKQAEEMKNDEPVKTEIADVVKEAMTTEARVEVAKEAKTKEDVMKGLIMKAIEKKKILLILDGDGEKSRMKAKIVPPIQKEKERAESDEQKKREGEKSGSDESQKNEDGGEKSGSDETVQKVDGEEKSGIKKKAGDKEEEKEKEKIVGLVLTGGEKPINVELSSLESYKVLKTSARNFEHELGGNEIVVKPLTWNKSKLMATRAIKREGVERNIKELEELASYFMIRSERLPAQLLLISRIVSYFGKKEDLRLQKEKLRLQKEELALQDEELRLQKEELAALQKGSSGLQREEFALQKEKLRLQKEKLKLQMEELALQDEELRLQKEELAALQKGGSGLQEDGLALQKENLALQMGELGLQKGKSELLKLRKDREMIRNGQGVKLLDVLIKGYEERLPKSVLIDCYSPEMPNEHFMHRGRAVNFNELICYWIVEGHLGHFDRIDEAYLKGHNVLMELMDCGLLHKHEADYVAPSGATTFNFHIHDYAAFFRGLRPGLAVTFDMNLGRVTLGDGMVRTISSESSNNDNPQKISTLLLDGNRIGEEKRLMESLCKHKDKVEVLAISDPTKQHFELPFLEMRNLRLLALRGCQFLDSLKTFLYKKSDKENDQVVQLDKENDPSPKLPISPNPISEKLEKLTVLEISGPSLLEPIPEELFDFMPKLKTVNLSELRKVEVLPYSFYNLPEIEFLILRGCESLRGLRSLKNFKKLKILDVSHATSFEKFEDKSLQNNTELQVLNISNTKLKTLPLINQLKKLKFVWLGDCQVLPRIRKIDKMGNLKIFDIGGAKDVERFCDPSLEYLNQLEIVDMSRTKIRRLPANIGDPTYLHANNCLKLKVVPPVEGLTKLEVLDLSGCVNLGELRGEFFVNIKESLRELNLSKTKVTALPFLSSLVSLRHLLLCECESLEKIEKLNCLEELEFLDLSGCKNLLELDDRSFDKMIHLHHLNLSRTGLGSRTDNPGVQKKSLPPLFKLENLKELYVRNCPNLTDLSGVEKISNLEILDYSGTILASPPSFKNPNRPKVVGAGIESIDTVHLFKTLGAQLLGNDQGEKSKCTQEEVSECQWIISNFRVEDKEGKLGKPVYGAHFRRLLDNYPSFLTESLNSKFYFLVYPSEAEANVKARFTDDNPYSEEVSLRKIYFDQVCNQKMDRCLEIREFTELPKSLHHLIAQAQFIVLVHNTFLKSLLDLHIDNTMPVKACWIESCNELQYIVAAPEKPEKTQEEAKSEEEQKKNDAAAKGEAGLHKKNAARKARAETKDKGGQQKNEKSGEDATGTDNQHKNDADAKSGGEQQQNDVVKDKSKESANGAGDQHENSEVEKAGHSATSEGDQPKTLSADNVVESGKGEANQQKHDAEEKSVDSEKNEGDEKKTVVDEKSEEPTKKEADESNSVAANNAGESEKGEANQQKHVAEEKPVDSKNNEEDKTKTHADERSEKPAENEADQSNNATANKAEELEKDVANQQKHVVEEISADSEKNDGEKKKTDADEKSENPIMKEADQSKNDNAGELAKIEGEEEKNAAKNFNKIEILWISDVFKMESICKGDIESVNFNFLKSLYLEFCPSLSEICSSSLQLQNLETLFIKYCQNLKSLFKDNNNASNMENLSHLQIWGLDSLEKINCKTLMLRKLRVGECPLLEHLLLSRKGEPNQENEGHAKLKILHIKSCDKLKGIFESSQDYVQFESLEELELQGLPQLRNVAHEAQSLSSLRVADCPSLKSVIAAATKVPRLKTLQVRNCVKMKTIIEGGASELSATKIELLGLPELENVGVAKLSRKNGCTIWACPKLKDSEFVD